MTKVRTLVPKKNYAKTQVTQNFLTLDKSGCINVIECDHMDEFLTLLDISSSKRMLCEDLINANVVFSLAEKIGLTPGLFVGGDAAIVDYITRSLSNDIVADDRALVIEELKASWQRVCEHPLVQDYIRLGEYRCLDAREQGPQFPGIGAFPFFVTNYFSGLVKLLLQTKGASVDFFLQLSELIYSASKGVPFCPNHFTQIEHLIESLKISEIQCIENQDIHAFLINTQTTYNEETSPWLRRVLGWVMHELEDIESAFPLDCAAALRNVLSRTFPLSINEDLNAQLEELWKYLHWPQDKENTLMTSSKFPRSEVPVYRESFLCTQAIEYSIAHYAFVHGIDLYPRPLVVERPMFHLAGGTDEEEMRLVAFLEVSDNAQLLQPFEWFAIARRAKRLELQERVNYEIEMKMVGEKYSQMLPLMSGLTIGSPYMMQSGVPSNFGWPAPTFTPRWSKVKSALKGSTSASSSTDVQTQVPAPNMEAILQLREERGCCIC